MKVTQPIHEEPANSKPVTLVEGRTLKPGYENDFYAWVQRAIAASERFPGNQGVTILTLGKGHSQARYVIHRFADEAAERAWMQSEIGPNWCKRQRSSRLPTHKRRAGWRHGSPFLICWTRHRQSGSCFLRSCHRPTWQV